MTENTTVIDSCSKKFDDYEVIIWDTAGQECFKSLNRLYFRDVKACILVHDVTKGSDFSGLDTWITEFMDTATSTSQSQQ